MYTAESLPINGYRGEPVPNEFLRQEGESDHVAVLLPGMGYTCDMPLFYYAESLLLHTGADVLRVEYAYNRRPDFRELPQDEQRRWLLADATASFRAALGQRPYREVTLIGKSLGTLAMGHLLAEFPGHGVRAVWLTPLLREDGPREQMRLHGGPTLLATGTAHPFYDPLSLDEVPEAIEGQVVLIEGADHGLDIPGDPIASVKAVEQVVGALQEFLGTGSLHFPELPRPRSG
jgi:pimeloyl-ACP methyl ester carboxylesterase